jgi:hypothetical protein
MQERGMGELPDEVLAIASRFRGGPSETALVCTEVMEGAPILCIVRKCEVWQFLCGRDHSSEYIPLVDPRIWSVGRVVTRDPTVAPVATMHDHHIARRRTPSDPWSPQDDLSQGRFRST